MVVELGIESYILFAVEALLHVGLPDLWKN